MARAKSALMTRASAWWMPDRDRTPTARRPWKRISSTSSSSEMVTPSSSAALAITSRDLAAAADRVKDAVLVLEEREDREEARAVERRHPQVFRLERHRQPDPRIVEIAAQLAVEREPGPQQGKHLEQLRREQVAPAQERRFQDAPELVHLDAVVVQEAAQLAPRRAARGPRSPAPSGRTSGVACSSPPAPKTR